MKHLRLLLLIITGLAVVSFTQLATQHVAYADLPPSECTSSFDSSACQNAIGARGRCYGGYYQCDDSTISHIRERTSGSIERFVINLALELLVAIVVAMVLKLKQKKKLLLAVALVNIVSFPVFYAVASITTSQGIQLSEYPAFLIIAELAIWLAEAAGILLLNRKTISQKQALLLSGVANLSTIAVYFALNKL